MPRRPSYSRFIFETTETTRTFRHQRYINDFCVDCDTCVSVVHAHEPYSHHWLTGSMGANVISLSLEEKLLLKRIERERVETFLLCDESAVCRTNDFLLEAGMDAVPQLLRFLNYEASRLEVIVGFYVNVIRQRMYFESSAIYIDHYLDIEETVDMLFSMLLEKISNYVYLHHRVPLEACVIKRMKLIVKRHSSENFNSKADLPLQYRLKHDGSGPSLAKKKSIDHTFLLDSFLNYHGQRFGNFPASLQVNLYCFRTCASSKELYAVPYLLRGQDTNKTPTYIIQTDVTGEFRGLHEIRNVRKFLKTDLQDRIIECRQCKAHFADRVQFALHRKIDCGRSFMAWQLGDVDGPTKSAGIELHENCLPMPKKYFKYAWFGLINGN
ncbi:protein terminus [Drosophila tropicalis]|uniref:protein terminus n=1 Tax=Drosophila tropicalis TaxID=46794 RepID=UPI0035ABB70E